ncbi:MAG: hypothetical protein ACOC9Y_06245, partial [Chloroflexota bacterium]
FLPWATISLVVGFGALLVFHRANVSCDPLASHAYDETSVIHALRPALGETLWQVILAAAIASLYEVVLQNQIALNPALWAVLLGVAAAVLRVRPGPAAILGSPIAVAAGPWVTAICILIPVSVSHTNLPHFFARQITAMRAMPDRH